MSGENPNQNDNYPTKDEVNIVKVNQNDFEICIPKLVDVQKWHGGKRSKGVHFTEDGVFTIDL